MKRIFISGPLTKGDLAQNLNQATDAFVRLATAGLSPFCPHWGSYCKPVYWTFTSAVPSELWCQATAEGNDAICYDRWLSICMDWLSVADAVLRLPGESAGADAECRHAEGLGIPVFTSIDDVINHFKGET